MPEYQAVVAVSDHPEPGNIIGKRRDDIQSFYEIRRGQMGRMDLCLALAVPVKTIILPEVEDKLNSMRYYDGGLVEDVDFREIEPEDNISAIIDRKMNVYNIKTQSVITRPDKLSKNRFQIGIDKSSLDIAKLEDPDIIYQPYQKLNDILAYWTANISSSDYHLIEKAGRWYFQQHRRWTRNQYQETINGKVIRFIRPKEPANEIILSNEPLFEIFCDASGIGVNDEILWDWDDTKKIVKDKHTKNISPIECAAIGT